MIYAAYHFYMAKNKNKKLCLLVWAIKNNAVIKRS